MYQKKYHVNHSLNYYENILQTYTVNFSRCIPLQNIDIDLDVEPWPFLQYSVIMGSLIYQNFENKLPISARTVIISRISIKKYENSEIIPKIDRLWGRSR